MANRANELRRVEIVNLLPLDNTFADPKLKDNFFQNSLFASAFVRPCIANGTASYIPTLLSEMPRLFDENILPLDAALIQVSPPDKHGYCSLGISVDVTRSAIRNAKKIIAQINRHMPRVHGDTFVHMNEIDAYVEHDEPLVQLDYSQEITDVDRTIGKRVAELIDDKCTRKQKENEENLVLFKMRNFRRSRFDQVTILGHRILIFILSQITFVTYALSCETHVQNFYF